MSELNQFCLLASSQKGLALTALIQQVLNSKKIYNFGELLCIPSVQALATQSEYIKSFATLELFAYGTYFDFVANRNRYLELTSEQGNKLRLLSIDSLASANHELHYSTLKEQLYITDLRELEDIIIECIYSGLINGKIDHRNNILRVSECIRRDVPTAELENIINTLKEWKNKMKLFENTLKSSSETIQISRNRYKEEAEEAQKAADKTKNSLQQQASSRTL